MITGEKIIGWLRHKSRNPNVVPGLGVLSYEDIISL
jgi:hypothetical protein